MPDPELQPVVAAAAALRLCLRRSKLGAGPGGRVARGAVSRNRPDHGAITNFLWGGAATGQQKPTGQAGRCICMEGICREGLQRLGLVAPPPPAVPQRPAQPLHTPAGPPILIKPKFESKSNKI